MTATERNQRITDTTDEVTLSYDEPDAAPETFDEEWEFDNPSGDDDEYEEDE